MKFNIRKVQNGYIVKEPGLRGREWATTEPVGFLREYYKSPRKEKEFATQLNFSVDKVDKKYTIIIHDGYVELIFAADTFSEVEEKLKGYI